MMKMKKLLCVLLCAVMLLTAVIPASAAAQYPKTVSEPVRIIDGIAEMIRQLACMANFKRKYENCKPLCDIPELDGGFVPQGFCYIDSKDMFAITCYGTDDENSVISLIDASTGERVKTVSLLYEDGTPCKAHAGGIADIGDSLLVSAGKSVRRLKLEAVLAAEDYSEIAFCGKLSTHMQASYVCSYENTLFIGQYYNFTLDGSYDTPQEQRVYTPSGKRHYAMCETYDMSDMDAVFEKGEAVPTAALSMPDCVQGIAYNGETLTLSISAGPFAVSPLKRYELKDFETEWSINLDGNDVPLVFIDKDRLIDTVKQPPMMEGIDCYKGRIAGIFESGAKKFGYALVRTPYVCDLGTY